MEEKREKGKYVSNQVLRPLKGKRSCEGGGGFYGTQPLKEKGAIAQRNV